MLLSRVAGGDFFILTTLGGNYKRHNASGYRRSSAHIRLTRYLCWKKDFVKLQRCQSRLWQRKWQRSNSKTSPPGKTCRQVPQWHRPRRARPSPKATRTRPVPPLLLPLQRNPPPKPGKAPWACSPQTPPRCRKPRLWSVRTRSRTAEMLLSTVTVPLPRRPGWKRWVRLRALHGCYIIDVIIGPPRSTSPQRESAGEAPIVWRC